MLHNPCNIFREYVQRLFKAPQPELLDTQDRFYKALLDVSNEAVLQECELRRCFMLTMKQNGTSVPGLKDSAANGIKTGWGGSEADDC